MSWGQYHPQAGGPGPDPYGRMPASSEPPGFGHNGLYAQPGYNGQHGAPGYNHPGPGAYGRPYIYHYDAAHPPRPAVGFIDAIRLFFKNALVFHGRASRSEFWWVQLGGVILTLLLVIPMVVVVAVAGAGSQDPPAALGIYVLLLVVLGMCLALPSISLQVRRLHDAGFSGFFSIFAYIPYLNSITFLVPLIMSIMAPSPEGVKYDNPNGSQPVAP